MKGIFGKVKKKEWDTWNKKISRKQENIWWVNELIQDMRCRHIKVFWVLDGGKYHHEKKARNYRSVRNRKTENSWLLVPYSTKANHFCELHGSHVCPFCLLNSQKQLAFIEYGSRSQEFSVFVSDRSVGWVRLG